MWNTKKQNKQADKQSEQRTSGKCSFRSATLSYLIVLALNCGIAYIWGHSQPASNSSGSGAYVCLHCMVFGCGNFYNNCIHFCICICSSCCCCRW